MLKIALFCLFLALFSNGILADLCLGLPSALSPGSGCGGPIGCKLDSFCHEEGYCEKVAKAGEDCEKASCELGTSCKGPTDFKRCVALVHPGQDCASGSSQSAPGCGSGSCSGGICRGGRIGDACYENDDCSSGLNCTSRVCTGASAGQYCDSDIRCGLNLLCTDNLCTALPTSGNCSIANTCALGYSCIYPSAEAEYPQCVAKDSLAEGQFCDGDSTVCESLRCYQDYCAKDSPSICSSNGQCSRDETCSCGGSSLIDGFGTCRTNPCFKLIKAFEDCWQPKCETTTYFNGSCVQRNCEKQYLRQRTCSSASSLFFSFSSIAFFALLASLFPRYF